MEQAEQALRALLGGRSLHLGSGGRKAIAGRLELLEVVLLVLALAGRVRLRQEVGRAAAHHHVRLHLEEHAHDVVVVAAPAHMRHHASGRGVLDLGVGHHADGHAAVAALGQLGDGLDLGMSEPALVARAIDAHGVHARLVAGRVGAHGVGRVRHDRVRAGGRHKRHVRHVVDGKLAADSDLPPSPSRACGPPCGAPSTGRRRRTG